MDEYQTQSEKNGLVWHKSLSDALEAAKKDPTIWKVSFNSANGERVRLIKSRILGDGSDYWILERIGNY